MIVPSSNRGLKSPQMAKTAVSIDYLTVTFGIDDFESMMPSAKHAASVRSVYDSGAGHAYLADQVLEFVLGRPDGLTMDQESKGMRHFYGAHYVLRSGDDMCGFIALDVDGSQRNTICLQLTGQGCELINNWAKLRGTLETLSARLTRVDIAGDDFTGSRTLADVRRWYEEGKFTTNGRPPALGEAGYNDDSGKTLYVGKNTGNQILCAYEKGKQLGDRESPWVRFEARFGAKYRDICYSILTSPAAFLRGHFPVLDWFSDKCHRMVTKVQKVKSSLEKSLRWCKHQYGGLIRFLVLNAEGDLEQFGKDALLVAGHRLPAWHKDAKTASLALNLKRAYV